MDLGKKNKQIFVKQISTSGWEQGGAHTDYENVFKIGNPGDGIFVSSEGDRFMISGGLLSSESGIQLITGVTGELFSGNITGVNLYIGPVGENSKGSGLFVGKEENRLLFRSVVGGSGIKITGHTGDLVIDFTGKPSPEGQNIGTDSSATGLSGVFKGIDQTADGTNIFQFRSLSGAGNVIVTGDTGRLIISGNDRGGAGGGGAGGGGFTGFHNYDTGPTGHSAPHPGEGHGWGASGGIGTGTGPTGFTGSFEHSFSEVTITGDIVEFSMSGMATGAATTIKITCPTGNNVYFNEWLTFVGEKPTAFISGKTGILVFTSFGTGITGYTGTDANNLGYPTHQPTHHPMPSGVLAAYGVQD
jgi:hypothetical protein